MNQHNAAKDLIADVDLLSANLRLALSHDDWELVAQLDTRLRNLFMRQSDLLPSKADIRGDDVAIMTHAFQNLLSVYKETLTACERHRASLQTDSSAMHRNRKVVRAYHSV